MSLSSIQPVLSSTIMQRSTKASNKAVKKAKLVRKAYKAVEGQSNPLEIGMIN